MKAPDPADYFAVWNERVGSGARLGSKNLWIYERASRRKQFSVTTQAGIKLQPYFEVPPPDDPNLCIFIVQGEDAGDGNVRLWITAVTARDLRAVVGEINLESVSRAILSAVPRSGVDAVIIESEEVVELLVSDEAYARLTEFDGPSDEHRMRAFIANAQGAGNR